MDYLFDHIETMLDRIGRVERVFFLLDYDGTLTDIVPHPDQAYLSEEMKATLAVLRKIPKISVAIVSGRSLRDIRDRVGLRGIYYVGNHGLEIFEPKSGTKQLLPKEMVKGLEQICARLSCEFKGMEGILLEDKKCTLAVHYRNADSRWIPSILFALEQQIKTSMIPLQLCFGKKVFEIRPKSRMNKGTAVSFLLSKAKRKGMLPIYIGDDRTDEDAFRVLKRKGITISVGESDPVNSSAQYYVGDPSEVFQFLRGIERDLCQGP